MAFEPTVKPADPPYSMDEIEPANLPRSAGRYLDKVFDLRHPMGTWTGLPTWAGAPLSGALWGAGMGGLYGLYRKLTADENSEPGLLTPTLVGAGIGTGLGALTAYNMAKSGSFRNDEEQALDRAIRMIRNDRSLSDAESSRVIHALRMSQGQERKRLLAMAAAGTLTGIIASRILGLGIIGSAIAGVGMAGIVGNHLRPKFYV